MANAIEQKDMDCVMSTIYYETREQADKAARRCNAFEKRPGTYRTAQNDDDSFYVEAGWRLDEDAKRREACADKIILVNFGSEAFSAVEQAGTRPE